MGCGYFSDFHLTMRYGLLAVGFFVGAFIRAQTSPLETEQSLQQQQQQFERGIREEQLQKQRQLDQRLEEPLPKVQAPVLDTLPPEARCFKLDTVVFKGEHHLSDRRQKRLVGAYLNRCLTPPLLRGMVESINNDYIRRGYITTRVYLQSQNIGHGRLDMLVIPGKLEKIRLDSLDGDRFFTKTRIWTAFGRLEDKVLNLKPMEQAIDQLNRLSSYRTDIKFLPSAELQSYSIAQVTMEKQSRTTRLRLSANNLGQAQTGLYSGKLILEQDNLLRLNETFYGAYTNDLTFDAANRYSRNIYFSLEIPLHWWTISGSYVASFYLNTIMATNTTLHTSGVSRFSTFKVGRKVFRNQANRLEVFAGLDLKNTVSFIEDVRNQVGSRNLSIATLGATHSVNGRWGYLNSTLSLVAGLRAFGAYRDVGGGDAFTPRAQYEKGVLGVSYYKGFKLLGQFFSAQSYLSGQYSLDPLFSSEQVSIGGSYSIRGFRDKFAFGDDGLYVMNTLSYQVPGFTKFLGLDRALAKTQLFVGYDHGYVRQKGGPGSNFGEGEASLSGLAVGLRFNGKFLQFDVTYAESLKTESFIGKSKTLYFNVTLRVF